MAATRIRKRAADIKVGDAVVFIDAPVVVLATHRLVPGFVDVIPAGPGSFRFALDTEVEVEEVTPGPYDGYMSAVPGGWHVVSEQQDCGIYVDEAAAATVLAETAKRPRWKVHADGHTVRLG